MEDRRAVAASRCTLAVALVALAGCHSSRLTEPARMVVVATPSRLAVAQRVDAHGSRYILCAERECPRPSPKTQVAIPSFAQSATTAGRKAPRVTAISIDIPFAFNATRIRTPDLLRLRSALNAAPTAVTIIGRSDFVGSWTARQRTARARAQAVRAAIDAAQPDLDAHVKLDIARAPPDPTSSRALQRRASVVFTPSSNQP